MKTVGYKEYMDQICAEYPAVDRQAIGAVIRHGLAMLGLFRQSNHDVLLNNNRAGYYIYFGDVTTTSLARLMVYRRKIRRKLRLLYTLRKTQFSGYLYFGLTEEEQAQYTATGVIDKAFLWRIEEESKVYGKGCYFYRVPHQPIEKWLLIEENYETKDAEFLHQRIKNGSKSINYAEQCTD